MLKHNSNETKLSDPKGNKHEVEDSLYSIKQGLSCFLTLVRSHISTDDSELIHAIDTIIASFYFDLGYEERGYNTLPAKISKTLDLERQILEISEREETKKRLLEFVKKLKEILNARNNTDTRINSLLEILPEREGTKSKARQLTNEYKEAFYIETSQDSRTSKLQPPKPNVSLCIERTHQSNTLVLVAIIDGNKSNLRIYLTPTRLSDFNTSSSDALVVLSSIKNLRIQDLQEIPPRIE